MRIGRWPGRIVMVVVIAAVVGMTWSLSRTNEPASTMSATPDAVDPCMLTQFLGLYEMAGEMDWYEVRMSGLVPDDEKTAAWLDKENGFAAVLAALPDEYRTEMEAVYGDVSAHQIEVIEVVPTIGRESRKPFASIVVDNFMRDDLSDVNSDQWLLVGTQGASSGYVTLVGDDVQFLGFCGDRRTAAIRNVLHIPDGAALSTDQLIAAIRDEQQRQVEPPTTTSTRPPGEAWSELPADQRSTVVREELPADVANQLVPLSVTLDVSNLEFDREDRRTICGRTELAWSECYRISGLEFDDNRVVMPIFVSRDSEWVELLLNSEDGDLNIDGAALLGTIVRSDVNLETGQVSVALAGSLNEPSEDGRPLVELAIEPG